jgi:hypothetical protein
MTIELVAIGPLDRRRRCECCGFPTLGAPDEYEPDPQWDATLPACNLCEWESRPLDWSGDVRSDSTSDQDRNDGLTVDTARNNFARFLSIYDPENLPPWKIGPPSSDIVDRRQELSAAYNRLPNIIGSDGYEAWKRVRACEAALWQALKADQARNEEIDESAT